MSLVIILNIIACAAVVAGVMAPLTWAIFTQHRHEPAAVALAHRTRPARARAGRGQQPAYEPI